MAFTITIPASVESAVNEAFSVLHYTFATRRPIFFSYGPPFQMLTAPDINCNPFFTDNNSNGTITTTVNSGMFFARTYCTPSELNPLRPNDSFVTSPEGELKLTTDITGKNLLDTYKANNQVIKFDGQTYRISSDDGRHGLLRWQFYDYTLEPTA